MARTGATLGLSLLLSVAVACDSAGEHEGCVDGTNPSTCPRSFFQQQDSKARDISGVVRRGEDGVVGARVRIAPAIASISSGQTFLANASTDSVGFYRVQGAVPTSYDLSFVLPDGPDGRSDVLVYRGASLRYLEPQFNVVGRTLPRAFKGHVEVQFDTALPAGSNVLFLAAGDGVYGVTGDLERGLDVHTARYEQSADLRAIVYDAAKGLVSASLYARAFVTSDAGTPAAVTMHLVELLEKATPRFTIDLPPGFVPGSVEVRIAASRTSDALFVSIPWGTEVEVPLTPDQGFKYTLRATRADGAISESGERDFYPWDVTPISLPAPVEPSFPEAGASIAAGDPLLASGSGILEHLFEPELAGDPSIDVVQRNVEGALPNLVELGVSRGTGNYTWTVRRFPTMRSVADVWGPDARRYIPQSTSAPRKVVLR